MKKGNKRQQTSVCHPEKAMKKDNNLAERLNEANEKTRPTVSSGRASISELKDNKFRKSQSEKYYEKLQQKTTTLCAFATLRLKYSLE